MVSLNNVFIIIYPYQFSILNYECSAHNTQFINLSIYQFSIFNSQCSIFNFFLTKTRKKFSTINPKYFKLFPYMNIKLKYFGHYRSRPGGARARALFYKQNCNSFLMVLAKAK
jgi:hypothetical protein